MGTIHTLSNELEAGHYCQISIYTNTWNELASADYTNTPLLIIQNTNPYNFTSFITKRADSSSRLKWNLKGFLGKITTETPDN